MQALRVALTETLGYWTVVGENWRPVEPADSYLRHLRLGADRAEGTTRAYAGDLACFLAWCEESAHRGTRSRPSDQPRAHGPAQPGQLTTRHARLCATSNRRSEP